MPDDRDKPRYSREEVEEILRRAAERTDASGDVLLHDELIASAREAGIDVSAVEEAAGELAEVRQDRNAVERWKGARRRAFASHLLTWAVVNAGLFLIDLLSGGGWWFFWPLLGWGIAVALQAVSLFREPTPAQVERITRKDRRRRASERKREARRAEREARRAEREARRQRDRDQRDRRKRVEKEFERAVESGVTALLAAAAKRIDKVTRRDEGPLADTEFNRYVTRKKGGRSRARVAEVDEPTAGPRVRVDDDTDEDEDDEERSSRRGRGRARR